MCVGPNGEISNGDNQGTWVPVDYIHYSKPGDFIEVPDLAHRTPAPTNYSPHLCWVPYDIDNSNGTQIWVPANQGKWGPFEGRMLYLSYGKSSLFAVLQERVGDVLEREREARVARRGGAEVGADRDLPVERRVDRADLAEPRGLRARQLEFTRRVAVGHADHAERAFAQLLMRDAQQQAGVDAARVRHDDAGLPREPFAQQREARTPVGLRVRALVGVADREERGLGAVVRAHGGGHGSDSRRALPCP